MDYYPGFTSLTRGQLIELAWQSESRFKRLFMDALAVLYDSLSGLGFDGQQPRLSWEDTDSILKDIIGSLGSDQIFLRESIAANITSMRRLRTDFDASFGQEVVAWRTTLEGMEKRYHVQKYLDDLITEYSTIRLARPRGPGSGDERGTEWRPPT